MHILLGLLFVAVSILPCSTSPRQAARMYVGGACACLLAMSSERELALWGKAFRALTARDSDSKMGFALHGPLAVLQEYPRMRCCCFHDGKGSRS